MVPTVVVFNWDGHYYFFSLLVTIAMQLSCFMVAYLCQFDKITDFAGALNFIILAILTLCLGGQYHARQILMTSLLVVSRLELGGFLLLRVLKRGKDARFDTFRQNFFKFLGFWIYQILWVYGCMLSVIFVNTLDNRTVPLGSSAFDYIGTTLFIVGFLMQFVSDVQKYHFRANPDNRGKVCNVGLWAITRHPNYFGEMLMFWGLFATTVSTFAAPGGEQGWATIISPLWTMVILLFVGGMVSAEGSELKRFYSSEDRRTRFEEYRNRTPPLIPFAPACYGKCPLALKRLFCCEWKMYEYSPPAVSAGDNAFQTAGGQDTHSEGGSPTLNTALKPQEGAPYLAQDSQA